MDAQTRSTIKKEDVFIHSTQVGLDWIAENRTKALRVWIAVLVVTALVITGVVIYQQRSQAAANAFGAAVSIYSTPIADPAQPDSSGHEDLSHCRRPRKGGESALRGCGKALWQHDGWTQRIVFFCTYRGGDGQYRQRGGQISERPANCTTQILRLWQTWRSQIF